MNKFGFTSEILEFKPLVLKDINEIEAYEKFSPIVLKKGSLVFVGEPFSYWLFVGDKKDSFHQFGALPSQLPPFIFNIQHSDFDLQDVVLGWGLGYYVFDRYKTSSKVKKAKLFATEYSKDLLEAVYMTRDLINTPPNDLGPENFCYYAQKIFKQIKIHPAIEKDWPSVFAVGKGSQRPPYVLEIDWSHENPKFSVGLAGKGVCFDTGGYDVKSPDGMLLMKKDMGGAAQALALTKWIIDANLPLKIKTIIPLAENSISGQAYRPSDVISTKKGTTVEVGNTDAEGRLVLCDALHALSDFSPDYIIDFATLTGAARVALGVDLPALFSNNDEISKEIVSISHEIYDPLWHMPLWHPYKEMLHSAVADLNNVSKSSYGGAIIAALFLNHFVPKNIPWIHIDFMGWNLSAKPARPEGGESMGMRSIFEFLKRKTEQ